jgi:hypothetical protein
VSGRCADISAAARESIVATATTADTWLVLEVQGTWPRDVSTPGVLSDGARAAVSDWLAARPGARLQFVRRPGRAGRPPLAFVVRAEEETGEVRRVELEALDDLERVDLDTAGDTVDGSLVLVCGHGSRDQCCAVRGTAVFGVLSERLGDEELWVSSHQGGHRFAANVLVLPAGLQFGRVAQEEASFLVARALAGRIELDRYRGRTCYQPAVQAAELAVRVEAVLDGVADLRLVAANGGTVRFLAWDGAEYAAIVDEVFGPSVPASCGADPEPQRAFAARLL